MIHLEVAGVFFDLAGPSAAWLAPLRARYRAFVAAAGPRAGEQRAWQVLLTADPDGKEVPAPWVRHEPAVTHFAIGPHRGWIDLAQQQAVVSAPSPAWAASAVERVLAYILMQALPRAGAGLLLHGAAVVLDGCGLAFCGPSGAGKTTVARLAQGYAEVLTDENLVVALAGPQPMLLSTPFWGASTPAALIRRVNRQAPLRALFLLEHAPACALTPLDAGQAVLALLSTEKVAVERVSSATAWLDAADRLVHCAPVYRLRFPPTVELWAFLASQL